MWLFLACKVAVSRSRFYGFRHACAFSCRACGCLHVWRAIFLYEKELRPAAPNSFCFIVLLNIGAKRSETTQFGRAEYDKSKKVVRLFSSLWHSACRFREISQFTARSAPDCNIIFSEIQTRISRSLVQHFRVFPPPLKHTDNQIVLFLPKSFRNVVSIPWWRPIGLSRIRSISQF
jgi:hypothetical protein